MSPGRKNPAPHGVTLPLHKEDCNALVALVAQNCEALGEAGGEAGGEEGGVAGLDGVLAALARHVC